VIPPFIPTVQIWPFFVPEAGMLATVDPIPIAPVIAVPLIVRFMTNSVVARGPGLR
jgi:hypothetical protein